VTVVAVVQRTCEVKARAAKDAGLTELEAQVIRWLSLGKRYAEISELMLATSNYAISTNSVKQCAHRAMTKLGVATPPGLVAKALRLKVIT
jgi:DNA-binding CsgD family transcriptional regulator